MLIARQSYWLDEGIEVLLARMDSAGDVMDALRRGIDKAPPAYHLLAWAWARLGGSTAEGWLRLPSALLSTAAIPATYLIARRLAPRAALLAAAAMAVSPFAIAYGQEARMYALALAASAWSVVAFLRALDGPRRAWPWIAWACLRVLAAYTHPYTLLLGAPEAVVALRRPELRRRFLAAAGAQAVLFAPWLAVIASIRQTAGLPKELSPAAIAYTGFSMIFGVSLGPSVAELHVQTGIADHWPVLVPAALAVGVPALAWARRGSQRALVAGYVVTPIAGAFAAGLLTDVTYNVRYAIAALPFVLVALSEGLVAIGSRAVRAAAALALGALLIVSLFNWYGNDRYAKEDVRAGVAAIRASYQPGDAIVLLSASESFRAYAEDLPFIGLYGDRGLDANRFEALRSDGRLPADRVWVLRTRRWETDPDGDVLAWFLSKGEPQRVRRYAGAEVYLLRARSNTGVSAARIASVSTARL